MNSTQTPGAVATAMSADELTKALRAFAETDLRYARKCGEHIVAGTKFGNVTLRHFAAEKMYSVSVLVTGTLTAQSHMMTKAQAAAFLIGAYEVVNA